MFYKSLLSDKKSERKAQYGYSCKSNLYIVFNLLLCFWSHVYYVVYKKEQTSQNGYSGCYGNFNYLRVLISRVNLSRRLVGVDPKSRMESNCGQTLQVHYINILNNKKYLLLLFLSWQLLLS